MKRGGNPRFYAERTEFGPMHGTRARLWSAGGCGRAQGRAVMIGQRHLIPLLGAVLTALVVCLGAPVAQAATRPHHKLTKREKTAARRTLQRQLRRNPGTVLKKGFLKKAQAVDLT